MENRRILRKIFSIAFILCLACAAWSVAVPSGQAYASVTYNSVSALSRFAASGAQLSDKKLSMDIGTQQTLKLKKAPGKVKWNSSNKKVASVTDKRGRNGSVVTIRAKGSGKCTITAKAGGKKFKCKITVSKIKIKPLSSSSVEKSSGYKFKPGLGKNGGRKFNIAVSDFSFELLRHTLPSAMPGQDPSAGAGTSGEKAGTGADAAPGIPDNILISPDSILTAMVMVENGAKGNTLKEMQNVLAGGIKVKTFNKYMAGLNNRLCESERMIYQQANSLWIRKKALSPKKSFLKKNKQYHNAMVYVAPFNGKTVKDINAWVFNNSRNMIDGIIDQLSPDDRMVLVNTTAFEGKWAEPFGDPLRTDFTAADGSRSKVKMLHDTGVYRYITLNGGTGFAKSYAGDDPGHTIAFVGLLPPEGMSVDDYLSGITGREWISSWNSSKALTMRIGLPQFKYDYSVSLEQHLSAMGIRDAFTDKADLSGMAAGGKDLQLDAVLHKTHIELDKNGTKAAAATAVIAKASSVLTDEPPEVILDRPFLYALVDTKTGIPLFAGIIYSVN